MSEPVWRTSSRSGSGAEGGQDCVQLADLGGGVTGVRDSKAPASGHLSLSPAVLSTLLARAKHGELDL